MHVFADSTRGRKHRLLTCMGDRLRRRDAALSGGLHAKYALSMALVCLLSRLRALRSRIITPNRFSMRTRDSAGGGEGGEGGG
jgi:hypothetical protein